jgi:hypothetical protein
MSRTKLLIKAYYEELYELLNSNKDDLKTKIQTFLQKEIKNSFEPFDEEKYNAYLEAAVAFLDERLETCNPIGFQYTLDRVPSEFARLLELQLNWYDSTAEYQQLAEAAGAKVEAEMTDEKLGQLAKELINEKGAFPDRSIISTYESSPALSKLPDYVLAKAIEGVISTR